MVRTLFISALFYSLSFLNSANAQTVTFDDFLKKFEEKQLPFDVNEELGNSDKVLPWEYYDFIPTLEQTAGQFNAPIVPVPVARFKTKNGKNVVLYRVRVGLKISNHFEIAVYDSKNQFVKSIMITSKTISKKDLTSL